MDELSVADKRKTGHYLTLDSPCNNKQPAINPLPIHMPKGETIMSTHTALFSKQYLKIAARKAHLFIGINKAFLSIEIFFDHGCQALFDDKNVLFINKWSRKVMMKGKRYPRSNLYMLNLTQQNKLMMEFTTPKKYFAGRV